jgi:hypothetical protein
MSEVDIVCGKLQYLYCNLTSSQITIRNSHRENASVAGFETGRVPA